jgi:virulence factor Mce-like protein
VSTEAKVGTFVLASLAILTVTLLYLANIGSRGDGLHYRTYLRYAGGLEPGAPVLFGGINAGRVTQVRPWASDATLIEILVDLKQGTPVNAKSVAKLGSLSLMSTPALMVSTGAKDADKLPPGDTIPSQEAASMDEIVTRVSTIAENANGLVDQLKEELRGISADARILLANLNSVTGSANRERIQAILEQANQLMMDARPRINTIMDEFSALTQRADGVVAKVAPLVDHADSTIQNVNGTVSDLRDPLRQDLAELQTTLQEAKGLLANMRVTVRANDFKIDDTLENLRMTSENLAQLTDSVKQRPWSLIRIKQPKDRKVPE